ncbi:hypothetical protein C2S53_019096 [Perilla frutescens var. hirtella]|uniref:Disease resistance protein At4g27190-like leucine-rich repeats domain-containing protein n=1 Tax=Perilla frutescens var. hirtella TaxID=608512 RepID=A0AAD4J5N9_PERFH|nr:hypothetical protein C2S51_029556 [Perilla frutescens var. frutescens]KAH6827642.1 hypothetical protein C2S53_019096 [Perilla frutescens var. hirtella]
MTSMVQSNVNSSEGTTNVNIDDHHYSHLFCQQQKISFGKLEELVTSRNPFCGHKVDLSCFNGLQELTICKYESSMSLFSFTIAQNLVTLRELDIRECDEIIQVIKDEEDKAMSAGERNRLFPNLQRLWLVDLRKFVSFCEWNCDVELPSLRFVNITGCPNIKNFSLAPNLEDFRTNLNNYLEVGVKVPFDSLKQLSIVENENPLYCYKIPVSLFSGLEKLEISWYHGSMSLFSSSVVGNLVNLKQLIIDCCYEMVKVIKDDEEENAVSGDGQSTTLLFPKLQELQLSYLPKLVSFCEWKCDVEFPSLRILRIYECPNMKYFTLGSLTTPNLKTAYINGRYFGAEKDLNVVLQKQYLAREKENQENEKKGSAEDQENKAEIEEEQNS